MNSETKKEAPGDFQVPIGAPKSDRNYYTDDAEKCNGSQSPNNSVSFVDSLADTRNLETKLGHFLYSAVTSHDLTANAKTVLLVIAAASHDERGCYVGNAYRLAELLGVSRTTASKALSDLMQASLIYKLEGLVFDLNTRTYPPRYVSADVFEAASAGTSDADGSQPGNGGDRDAL